METIAVFANDADSARRLLQPMLEGGGATHWVLVACPPRLTRHIGRWVTPSARRQWRERWAADLFAALDSDLRAQAGNHVDTMVAQRSLADLSAGMLVQLPHVRLLDARRPRAGRIDEPITATQPAATESRWAAPAAAAVGLSLLLSLAD